MGIERLICCIDTVKRSTAQFEYEQKFAVTFNANELSMKISSAFIGKTNMNTEQKKMRQVWFLFD